MIFLSLWFVSLVFGVLRFIVPVTGQINKKDIYKNLAHIWVGILIGYACNAENAIYWTLPVILTVTEVIAFIARKYDNGGVP